MASKPPHIALPYEPPEGEPNGFAPWTPEPSHRGPMPKRREKEDEDE